MRPGKETCVMSFIHQVSCMCFSFTRVPRGRAGIDTWEKTRTYLKWGPDKRPCVMRFIHRVSCIHSTARYSCEEFFTWMKRDEWHALHKVSCLEQVLIPIAIEAGIDISYALIYGLAGLFPQKRDIRDSCDSARAGMIHITQGLFSGSYFMCVRVVIRHVHTWSKTQKRDLV